MLGMVGELAKQEEEYAPEITKSRARRKDAVPSD
jgi:hypothetical protein